MAEPTLQEAIVELTEFVKDHDFKPMRAGDIYKTQMEFADRLPAVKTVLSAAASAAADRERAEKAEKDAVRLRESNEHITAALHAHAAECAEVDPHMAGEPERIKAMHTAYLEEGAWARAEWVDRDAGRFRALDAHAEPNRSSDGTVYWGFDVPDADPSGFDLFADALAAAPDAGQKE